MAAETHEGGCYCGAVRYRVSGPPRRVGACCCRWCQRRTGSVLGLSVYFEASDFDYLQGELRHFRLTSGSGRSIETDFCPTCATTVGWTMEAEPGARGIAGGTFDDPTLWQPQRFVFTRTKPGWLSACDAIPCYEALP